jgi:hypothetical protein
MPSKEIKELRQSGKLQEAYEMAKSELDVDPANIWCKRNISWVYFEYLKQNLGVDGTDKFIHTLEQIAELQLGEDEKMLFENVAWKVGTKVFGLIPKTSIPTELEIKYFNEINTIFEIIKDFPFPKPSEGYSFMFKAFHKHFKEDKRYIEFADWWGFENFMEKDFQKETLPNGKDMMSIVEQAYIGYAKSLLEHYIEIPVDFKEWCEALFPDENNFHNEDRGFPIVLPVNYEVDIKDPEIIKMLELFPSDSNMLDLYAEYLKNFRNSIFHDNKKIWNSFQTNRPFYRSIDTESIKKYVGKIDRLIAQHPEYQYPIYYKAKLLLKLGDFEWMLKAIIPFAKVKKNDFWVWEILAEGFPNDKDKIFACYCKGLTCTSPEGMMVGLRQKMAALFIERKQFNEAKTEILRILKVKQENDHRIPPVIANWIEMDWYKSATAKESNIHVYRQFTDEAEEILFHDEPEDIVVIEFVNTEKHMISFVKNKELHGFFKYGSQLKNPKIGDLLRVRLGKNQGDNYYKVNSVKQAKSDDTCEAVKLFKGKARIKQDSPFGFVEDIFLEPRFVAQNKLIDGQEIEGKAMLSFNKKKESWGWKGINISN